MRTCHDCRYVFYIKGLYEYIKTGCYMCNIYGRKIGYGDAQRCPNFKKR